MFVCCVCVGVYACVVCVCVFLYWCICKCIYVKGLVAMVVAAEYMYSCWTCCCCMHVCNVDPYTNNFICLLALLFFFAIFAMNMDIIYTQSDLLLYRSRRSSQLSSVRSNKMENMPAWCSICSGYWFAVFGRYCLSPVRWTMRNVCVKFNCKRIFVGIIGNIILMLRYWWT